MGRRGRPPPVPTPEVGLTQGIKDRRRDRVVGVEVRPVLGEPVAFPYPVHEERPNGVLRDRLHALARRTHAFAKDTRTWDAPVTVCLFEHNRLRPHPALREPAEGLADGRRRRRRTPAVALRPDRPCPELGRIPDFQTLSLPKGVATPTCSLTSSLRHPCMGRHRGFMDLWRLWQAFSCRPVSGAA